MTISPTMTILIDGVPMTVPCFVVDEDDEGRMIPMLPQTGWRAGAAQPTAMRRFYFDRNTDVSGMSGTGVVAEGVQFSDGRVALRWVTDKGPSSTVVYDSIEDAETIHGHGGGTKVVWVDGG